MPPRQPGTLLGGAWQLTLLVLTTAPVGSTGAEQLSSSGANPPPNPVVSSASQMPIASKPPPSFSWRGEWKGWEGFHFDLTRRTLLGELAPSVTNLPPIPMTLENVGSSRDMMFMESAAPLQALGPGVEAGFQVGRPILQRRMTWAFGLFTDGVGDDFGDATEDFGRAVVRITGLPIDTSPLRQSLWG